MTISRNDIESKSGPRYLAITEALAEAIRKGEIKSGDKLPTHRHLAEQLGVTVGTITRAYREATNRGLVTGEVGRGSFVSGLASERDNLIEMFPCPRRDSDDPLDLGPVLPARGNQDTKLAETLKSLADSDNLIDSILRYTPQPGMLAPHQTASATWLQQWIPGVDKERVFFTNGAQHALALACLSAAAPGETVLAENLAWFGIKAIARSFGMKLHGLEMDAEGIIPETLEAVCREHTPRVLFCSPTLQNPTTATMSVGRREAIVDIARKHDLTIVEDGVFDYLSEPSPPTLTMLAPERTFYVSSVSKCIGAGLRIGLMYVPEKMFDRVAGHNRAMLICVPPLMCDIVSTWIMDGTARSMVDWQCAEFIQRRKFAHEVFKDVATIKCEASWVWMDLPEPWTPGQFSSAANELGINIWPSERFTIGRTLPPYAVRVSLGGFGSRTDIEQALIRLGERLTRPIGMAPG